MGNAVEGRGRRAVYVGEFGDSLAVAEIARRRESEGFDGVLVGDSQHRYSDPFVTLALVADRTEHITIGTAVTNPVTRHAASMACAWASLQQISGGRAVAGIGRGDSSLAYLGAAPASVASFDRYVRALRRYLQGEEVDLDAATYLHDGTRLRSAADLELSGRPTVGRLQFLRECDAPVPVDVFASGPRTISVGATSADRLTLSVGADPRRVEWALRLAREARVAAGLDPAGLDVGASFAIGLDDDFRAGRDHVAGVVSVMARFAAMAGTVTGPVDPADGAVIEEVGRVYDMAHHARVASDQDGVLTDDFVARYAVVGPPGHCLERLLELFEIGLDRVHLVFHAQGADPERTESAYRRFASDVLPQLHR